MSRRILYLMHVDWRWIKQRPHFLAEQLSVSNQLRILHRGGVTDRAQLCSTDSHLIPFSLLPLPWSWRAFIWPIRALQRGRVAFVSRTFSPEIIWATHPSLLEAIPARFQQLPLVYDCMDDALAFTATPTRKERVADLERKLVARASTILCSSETLKSRLMERYGARNEEKITVVRNAVSDSILKHTPDRRLTRAKQHQKQVRLGYIGTISDWLDFGTLLTALNTLPWLEIHLAGPLGISALPVHERLIQHPPRRHRDLPEFASAMDALIMPFRVCPLVAAVDPVKLYEYLAFDKEVITVSYGEIERFSEYVHFYRSTADFIRLAESLRGGALPVRNRPELSRPFLLHNTWQVRADQVCALLDKIPSARPA